MKKQFRNILVCTLAVLICAMCFPVTGAAASGNPPYQTKKMGQITVHFDGLAVGYESFRIFVNLNGYTPKTVSVKISGNFTEAEQRSALEGEGGINPVRVMAQTPAPLIFDTAATDQKSIVDIVNGSGVEYFHNVYRSGETLSSVEYTILPPGDKPLNGMYIRGSSSGVEVSYDAGGARKTTYHVYIDGQLILEYTSNNSRISSYKIHDANFQTPPATRSDSPIAVEPTTSKIYIDGKQVDLGAYLINDNNYVRLRDIAYLLKDSSAKFEVLWDQNKNLIEIQRGGIYTVQGGELKALAAANATISNSQITCAIATQLQTTQEYFMPTAYNVDGNNFYKLRDIAHIAGFSVSWDAATNSVKITTK